MKYDSVEESKECYICFVFYVEILVMSINERAQGKVLCCSQSNIDNFDCLIGSSGTGMLMPRKALNGFGNHQGPVSPLVF